MLNAAAKALAQMASPSFRAVLLKSMGFAAAILVVLVIAIAKLAALLSAAGSGWAESALGPTFHIPVAILFWIIPIIAGLGLVAGAIFLMPAATAIVAGIFGDDIAELVERAHYPSDPAGAPLPLPRALLVSVKFALLTIVVYLCAVPFLLFAGLGVVIFFLANAYLLGRQYFELAAMRFHSADETRALRRAHAGSVMLAGMLIAAFVAIPIVNLATPLFGTALMVHMHKRLAPMRRR